MSHNNNSANSSGGNYTVSCEYFGTYTNNLPECISFENPTGQSDGNTYYYYLGSSNLSNVTSDSFTMGTSKGNAVQIGGDPVDSNRDWGNQWNNGQYNNSTFTFVNNSMFVTTSGDKPNSSFVKKPINNPENTVPSNSVEQNCSAWTPNSDVINAIKNNNVRFGIAFANSVGAYSIQNPVAGQVYIQGYRSFYYMDKSQYRNNSQLDLINRCIYNQIYETGTNNIQVKYVSSNLYDVSDMNKENFNNYVDQLYDINNFSIITTVINPSQHSINYVGPGDYSWRTKANYFSFPFINNETQHGVGNTWGQFTHGFLEEWESDKRPNILFIFTGPNEYGAGTNTSYWWGGRFEQDYTSDDISQLVSRNTFAVFVTPINDQTVFYTPNGDVGYYANMSSNVISVLINNGQAFDGQYIYNSIYNSDKFKKWILSQQKN